MIKNNNEKGKVVDCMAKTRFVEKKRCDKRDLRYHSQVTLKSVLDMHPLYCIANEGEYAKESLRRIKTWVFIKVH